MNQGRLEIRFEGQEDRIQTILIEINRKQIIRPKVIRMSWLRAENFGNLEQHLCRNRNRDETANRKRKQV